MTKKKAHRKMDYSILPEYMRPGMKRYVEEGIIPGDFLTKVLENDFMGAWRHADGTNSARMKDYAMFLYNEAPLGSYGSSEDVKRWNKRGGLNGIRKKALEDHLKEENKKNAPGTGEAPGAVEKG